jgi:RimJ/RimL family protein N-acetyltransferase
MKLKRIELYVEADNERSRHITEKLGYTLDRFDPIKQRYYYYMERE